LGWRFAGLDLAANVLRDDLLRLTAL
jgi:hypothetical protein